MTHVLRIVSLALIASPALADVSYPTFTSPAGLELEGSATVQNGALLLTPASSGLAGAAWAEDRQDVTNPFTVEFTFKLDGTADGLAFVIQRNIPNALGAVGGGLGYDGIFNGLAVEFDTFANFPNDDPSGNHVSVHTGGNLGIGAHHSDSIGSTSLVTRLNDGALHTVRIEYVPGVMSIYVDSGLPALQVAVDFQTLLALPGGDAWVGFTAATGFFTQSHEVYSWSFDENSHSATGNLPPAPPTIIAPAVGATLNSGAVHFELDPFLDPNSNAHSCTDYEIWSESPVEKVWRAACQTSGGLLAADLADGTFLGALAGASALEPNKAYVARARFRDDSADPLTEWGPWSESSFVTSSAPVITSLVASDIESRPPPSLSYTASGRPVELVAGVSATRFVVETAAGQALATIEGVPGAGNRFTDGATLPGVQPLRLRVESGGAALTLGATDLVLRDHACMRTRVLVPALSLAAGETALFWIGADGSTWTATSSQSAPVFAGLLRAPIDDWLARPGYAVEQVATGFQLPTNLAFVPNPGPNPSDPFLYVTELYGAIKVVSNDGTIGTYADGLLNYNPLGQFPGAGEQGLGSIAVDPQSGDVYLSLLYDQGGPHYPRVDKFTSLDGGLTAATQTTVLDMPGESQGQAHYISHLEILVDRTLLIHMGDGFVTATARDLDSFRGKILRANLDGTPPTNNPFFTPGPVTARDYVYCLGVRNPFGGRTRASDGAHYFVENGPGIDRFAQLVPGRDYLWAGTNAQMNSFALHAWSPSVGPVNLAWIEPETFDASGYPEALHDHGFVSQAGETYRQGPALRGKRITEFVVDAQGQHVSGPTTFVQYTGAGRSSTIGLAAGPHGLYFTDFYQESGSSPIAPGGSILRVRYTGDPNFECGVIGETYCEPAQVNSTGMPGEIRASGSPTASANDLVLELSAMPPSVFTLCLASRTQAFVQNPGNSFGNLCLGGSIGRFNAQVASTSATGTLEVSIDLTNLPAPLGTTTAGETWNFQAWYRDFQLVPNSNYTNGVSVTLE